ncbi:RGSL1 isoform 13 [Pongo abelii]|uniref:RGSL1 isoform 13 n=1 Tax=Pongo abelii TaxID=9601 RepID=A0A2J8V819_PONAB|nr:RGSL1 isoform 13 [Pongo abelii]
MSSAEIIRSTNLIILLEDEIFADFFNTFLSLPLCFAGFWSDTILYC